ncbi:hypothetical protein CDL12_10309 [Handroanthus impetiginosus]|uniref:DUF8040 domain-containing protein n=1 Tax=Handroanthus impetiginosus TaxID=429701 RepID=A0A2G9HHM6_9LAMI|nr:hypothetical protein CDL12_10309 [Handroanthus impetiginosus]
MEPWDIRDCLSVKLWDISNCIAISSNVPYDGEMSDINEDQIQKDLDWWTLCQVTTRSILTYYENYLYKVPCRTSVRTSHMFLEEILNRHGIRCYQAFCLEKSVFLDLCHELTHKYDLYPTRGMSVYEEVTIFLMTCAHGADNRLMHFYRVLKAVGKLANDISKPHPEYNEGKGYHRPQHYWYKPFFDISNFSII